MGSVLRLTPTDREKEQSTKQYTKNRKANEYFKKGRIQRFDVTEPSLRRAIHYFEQATKEDPDFARAYASIADTFIMMGMLNLIAPEESYIGARDAARKAREKDENMASAHTAWAFTKLFFEWQWKESREGFARAIEINPNSPSAHMGYAHWLTAQGLFTDAVTEINQALALDPYNFFTNFVRGMVFFLARQYEQSLEQFERTHELNLRFNLKSDLSYYGSSLAYEYLALANEGEARERLFEKADAEARKSITRSQRHPLKLMQRIHLKTIWGKRDEALKMLDEVIESQQAGNYVSQYHLAIVYASFEEVDLAIKCLEEAYKVRDQYLFLLAVDPRLDSLRSDPRFKNLLSRLSIENRR
jgi:tetratricopeptide (TPR) repeat protein